MDIKLANEIIACLPKDRTVFDYYKDRYAVMLLERVAGDGMAIADIKQTRYAKLLNRPLVKDVVARKGDGMLTRDDLIYVYPPGEVEHYVLTLGLWGWRKHDFGCDQTSRKGGNLVLQLNFSGEHDGHYRKFIDPDNRQPFAVDSHPICKKGRNTLAWARIDIDLDADEALIEEVQNDWLRDAESYLRWARTQLGQPEIAPAERAEVTVYGIKALDLVEYAESRLYLHKQIWSEAMLAAAIWFLTEEIGIGHIWYHDYETGAWLKNIGWAKPPRSLYTDLPKRFCFERTTAAPAFIAETAPRPLKKRLKSGKEHFWHMAA